MYGSSEIELHLLTYLMCLEGYVYLMEGIISRHYTDCLSRLIFLQSTPQQKSHFARPRVPSKAQREAIPPFLSLFMTESVKWVMHVASRTFLLRRAHCCLSNVHIWVSLWRFQSFIIKHTSNLIEVSTMNNKPSYFKV